MWLKRRTVVAIDWREVEARITGGCGRVRCEPSWRLKPGWGRGLSDCDLWFVHTGRGWMQTLDGPVSLRPGVCLWMRPGRDYVAEQDLDDRLGVSFTHFDLFDRHSGVLVREQCELPSEVHEVPDMTLFEAATRRIVALRVSDAAADGVCSRDLNRRKAADPSHARLRTAEQLLTGLLMDLDGASVSLAHDRPRAGTPRHHRDLMIRTAARINEDPANVPPVADLAREAGYSPDHFARLFKHVLGQSPQAYAVQARVERAKRLLADSPLSVGEVADALGYRDVYFFSRQFKAKTGRAPSAYRQQPAPTG